MAQQFIFEGSQATVMVTVLNDDTDEELKGIFKFRCLMQPIDEINIDAFYRELIGIRPTDADQKADRFAFSLSHLRYRIIDAPTWWKEDPDKRTLIWGGHCNKNIILEVFNLAVEAEKIYAKRGRRKAKDARELLEKAHDSGEVEEKLDVGDGPNKSDKPEPKEEKPEFLGD